MKPLPHVEIHIVDENGRPAPAGSTGSLLVGGGALAGGYLGVNEDNADDRLIETSTTGERLCRTGDKARVIARGCDGGSVGVSSTSSRKDTVCLFALIGREDAVVKVRGHLVAIAAVEAAFMQCYAVEAKACVAVAIPELAASSTDDMGATTTSVNDTSPCTEIGMAIVWNDAGCGDQPHHHQESSCAETGARSAPPSSCEIPSAADVRAALATLLPVVAVPLYIVELKQLPVDGLAGKCDRRAVQQAIAAAVYTHSRQWSAQASKATTATDSRQLNAQASEATTATDQPVSLTDPVATVDLPATDAIDGSTQMVQRLMAQVLQLPSDSSIQPEDDFFCVGGHSVAAVKLCKLLDCRIADLIAHSTPSQLARCLQLAGADDSVDEPPKVNLHRQVQQAEHLVHAEASALSRRNLEKRDSPCTVPHNVILLTGATGQLGSQLLSDFLLSESIGQDMQIVCLVRSVDDQAALERIQSSLRNSSLGTDSDSRDIGVGLGHTGAAVSALAGDVAAPLLGLAPDTWLALADNVCAVVHTAATVDRFAPLSALLSANVCATARLTHLAKLAGAAMHFISSRYAQVAHLDLHLWFKILWGS